MNAESALIADMRLPLFGGLLVTGILASLLASRVARLFAISAERAFRAGVAVGAVLLAGGAMVGILAGALFGAAELGQVVGSYAGVGIEIFVGVLVVWLTRNRRCVHR